MNKTRCESNFYICLLHSFSDVFDTIKYRNQHKIYKNKNKHIYSTEHQHFRSVEMAITANSSTIMNVKWKKNTLYIGNDKFD